MSILAKSKFSFYGSHLNVSFYIIHVCTIRLKSEMNVKMTMEVCILILKGIL